MVEPLAQELKAYTVLHPLDIAKSLSQGMGAVVPPKIDLLSPALDQLVGVADRDGVGFVLLASK